MKKVAILILALSFGVIGWASSGSALTIMDNYIGADPTRDYPDNADVVGREYLFGIDRMEVNLVGGELVVDVYSKYMDNIGRYQTGLGDLFISIDGWHPDNPTETEKDSFWSGGEGWEFVIALDDDDKLDPTTPDRLRLVPSARFVLDSTP